jgi:hypothetical protein
MNERIKQLMIQADYPAPELALRAQKLVELILQDVMSICEDLGDKGMDGHYCVDAIRKKYFGVDQEVTEPNGLHTCPYAEEIHNDYETLCDCDEEQQRRCAMNV